MMTLNPETSIRRERLKADDRVMRKLDEAREYLDRIGKVLDSIEAAQEDGMDASEH